MYETGNENYLTLLLTAGSISEMLNKADYVEALYQYDRDMLEQYEDTVTRIAELESQLESELSELQQSEEYLAQAETELDAELAKLKTESDNYELQLAEVKVQAANYSAQLKKQQTELGTIQNNLKSTKEEIKKEAEQPAEEPKAAEEQQSRKRIMGSLRKEKIRTTDRILQVVLRMEADPEIWLLPEAVNWADRSQPMRVLLSAILMLPEEPV